MTLRNPVDKDNYLPVYIEPNKTELAVDWQYALSQELQNSSELEKNY
jgi:hypothetical protein